MSITSRLCKYCSHPIDLHTDNFIRVDTLDSVIHKKPRGFAHELCAAEAELSESFEEYEEIKYTEILSYEVLASGDY